MSGDKLMNIGNSLRSTIKETDALYESCNLGGTARYASPSRTGNKGLRRFSEGASLKNKWVLPYTVPVEDANKKKPKGANKVTFGGSAVRASKDEQKSALNSSRILLNDSISKFCRGAHSNPDLEGWTEHQRGVFYRFVANAEREMHLESERLQIEYTKQLASKLEVLKSEMYESNRLAVLELTELRLQRDRWSNEEIETKKSLSLTKNSLSSLQRSFDNLRDEMNEKSVEIVRLNATVTDYEHLVARLQHKNMELERELAAKSEHLKQLQEDMANAYGRVELMSNKCTEMHRKMSSENLKGIDAQNQLKRLKIEKESLELTNQYLVTEKESLESRTKTLERELSDMTKENLQIQSLLRSVESSESASIIALRDDCKRLEEQLKNTQMEAAMVDKRHELAQTRRKMESLVARLKDLSNENDALTRENLTLQKQLDCEKTRLRDSINDLFATKCKLNSLRSEYKFVKYEEQNHNGNPLTSANTCKEETDNANPKREKQFRRDIFAPTMFDAPDPASQKEIDALERELTELHMEKDRMESEMVRCQTGPKSPAIERRRHFILDGKIAETKKKIQEISEKIRKLEGPE